MTAQGSDQLVDVLADTSPRAERGAVVDKHNHGRRLPALSRPGKLESSQ
jgi:hypothetical protein